MPNAWSSAGELEPVDACLCGGSRPIRVHQLEALTTAWMPVHTGAEGKGVRLEWVGRVGWGKGVSLHPQRLLPPSARLAVACIRIF